MNGSARVSHGLYESTSASESKGRFLATSITQPPPPAHRGRPSAVRNVQAGGAFARLKFCSARLCFGRTPEAEVSGRPQRSLAPALDESQREAARLSSAARVRRVRRLLGDDSRANTRVEGRGTSARLKKSRVGPRRLKPVAREEPPRLCEREGERRLVNDRERLLRAHAPERRRRQTPAEKHHVNLRWQQ